MRRTAACMMIGLALAPLPLAAEDPAPKAEGEGFSLMEEGAKLVLRGLMSEMEPTIKEMDKALSDMKPMVEEIGPRFQELIALMGDVQNYQAPEVLPNGDILIRRKVPLVPKIGPRLPGPNGEIEL